MLATLGNPRKRQKTLNDVLRTQHWDTRVVVKLPPSRGTVDDVLRELRSRRAPTEAYVISTDAALDGRLLSLEEAVRALVAVRPGGGVFISCIPGRLAYWESEHPGAGCGPSLCFVLQRIC